MLTRLGLQARRDSRPGELSRGMRQKVQLACALIRPYHLLLLDEPVVGLDPSTQRTLRAPLVEVEQFLSRAETRAGLTASAMTLDYRQATLTYRAATAGGSPRLLRVRRPERDRLVVLWRDALALIRDPSRGAWATCCAPAPHGRRSATPGGPWARV